MRKARALSPIVAVVLLVLIAVIGGVLIYAWLTNWAADRVAASSPSKVLSIEAATAKASSDEIVIYLRNDGSKVASIARIYYLKADGTIVEYYRSTDANGNDILTDGTNVIWNSSTTGESLDIQPGTVQKLTLTGIDDLQPGQIYRLRIVTYDGSQIDVTVKAV